MLHWTFFWMSFCFLFFSVQPREKRSGGTRVQIFHEAWEIEKIWAWETFLFVWNLITVNFSEFLSTFCFYFATPCRNGGMKAGNFFPFSCRELLLSKFHGSLSAKLSMKVSGSQSEKLLGWNIEIIVKANSE